MMIQPPQMPPPNLINPELAPKETLYLFNINDKVKPEDLKYGLYFLFSQFGEILKIILKKSNKLRGQCFIVFQNITSATNAKDALQEFKFYEKPLKIEFAHTRSNIFEQMEGNIFAMQPKKDLKSQKRDKKISKAILKPNLTAEDVDTSSLLMAEDLPSVITEGALQELFSQYPGLKDLKLIPARKLAFIEYDSEILAKVAMKGLNGFLLGPDETLKLKYAKKN